MSCWGGSRSRLGARRDAATRPAMARHSARRRHYELPDISDHFRAQHPSTPARPPTARAALPCPALLAGLLQPIAATTPRLLAASAPGESSHGTSTPLVTSPSPASGLRRLSDRRHWAPACPLCPPLQADHLHEILRSLRYRRTRSSPTPTARKPHHRGPA
jgi:hypothetical protein